MSTARAMFSRLIKPASTRTSAASPTTFFDHSKGFTVIPRRAVHGGQCIALRQGSCLFDAFSPKFCRFAAAHVLRGYHELVPSTPTQPDDATILMNAAADGDKA